MPTRIFLLEARAEEADTSFFGISFEVPWKVLQTCCLVPRFSPPVSPLQNQEVYYQNRVGSLSSAYMNTRRFADIEQCVTRSYNYRNTGVGTIYWKVKYKEKFSGRANI